MDGSYSLGVATAVKQKKRPLPGVVEMIAYQPPFFLASGGWDSFLRKPGWRDSFESRSEEGLDLGTLSPPNSAQLVLIGCSDSWGRGGWCMRSSYLNSAQQVLTAAPPLLP